MSTATPLRPTQARPVPSAIPEQATRGPLSGLNDTFVLARRTVTKMLRNPEQFIDVSLQPIIMTTIFVFIFGVVYAFNRKEKAAGNPWGEGATTLEWTLPSPPPFHQFETLPRIVETGH